MIARAKLPKSVDMVGDRIGLSYNICRDKVTLSYIEAYQDKMRLNFSKLQNSYYSLNEKRTQKSSPEGDKSSQKRQTKEPRNPLKLNARTRKRLYQITEEEKKNLRYATFEKVHELWLGYASAALKEKDMSNIFRMDLHGCKLTCTAANNPTLVGSLGIVVQETKNTFLVITQTNRLLTLPKRESLFEFEVNGDTYRIHGCNLLFNTQTRTKVKYKHQRAFSDV